MKTFLIIITVATADSLVLHWVGVSPIWALV